MYSLIAAAKLNGIDPQAGVLAVSPITPPPDCMSCCPGIGSCAKSPPPSRNDPQLRPWPDAYGLHKVTEPVRRYQLISSGARFRLEH
jgi:hypothetical protein